MILFRKHFYNQSVYVWKIVFAESLLFQWSNDTSDMTTRTHLVGQNITLMKSKYYICTYGVKIQSLE